MNVQDIIISSSGKRLGEKKGLEKDIFQPFTGAVLADTRRFIATTERRICLFLP